MNLEQLDRQLTDKNTYHSYFPLYERLLSPNQFNKITLLEIGVLWGGSIKLWNDYFSNATIYGIDKIDRVTIMEIKKYDNISLYLSNNAYDNTFIQETFISKNVLFNYIIDDGPHTLISMKKCISLYSKLLTNNGIMIIEDVQDIEWIKELIAETPDNLKPFIEIHDLRTVKNRYDDIVFVINKNKPT